MPPLDPGEPCWVISEIEKPHGCPSKRRISPRKTLPSEQSRAMARPTRVDTPKALPRSPHPPTRHYPPSSALCCGAAASSLASFAMERVMRPLRLPWLLAVLRPLEVTVSFSSLSSPDVSSFLSLQKQGGKKKHCWADLIFRSSNYFSTRVWGMVWGFFCWSFGGAGLHFFLHTQALFQAGLAVG